jgi:outer membrane receptor protein involved in Fe transport
MGDELELTMKRLLVALLATSAMALAAPAFAHPDHPETPGADESWNNGGATYGDFNQEYQHIWDGIQHGLSDGSYSRDQAQRFFNGMQRIRGRADELQREGRWDPRETQAQLERLHETMHAAHEEGHAIQDSHHDDDAWNNGGATYADFDQEYQHIWQGIQHGLSDRSYTRREAQGFYRAMQQIRARANWMERSGRYDPEDTQARLESLHEAMHAAHERGHERLDRYNNSDWNYRR